MLQIIGPVVFLLPSGLSNSHSLFPVVALPAHCTRFTCHMFTVCSCSFILRAGAPHNKIIGTMSSFEQQFPSSLGTGAINRKCSLTLSHSVLSHPPLSSLFNSLPLSGSGFVSAVSMCVVRRYEKRWNELRWVSHTNFLSVAVVTSSTLLNLEICTNQLRDVWKH